jgi:hypothetical protein
MNPKLKELTAFCQMTEEQLDRPTQTYTDKGGNLYCSCHNRVCRFKCDVCGCVAAEKARMHLKDKFPQHKMLFDKNGYSSKRTREATSSSDDEEDESDEEPADKKRKNSIENDQTTEQNFNEAEIEKQTLLNQLKFLVITDSALNPSLSPSETMFYDLVIRVEGMLFYCSKSILALRSSHFKKMIIDNVRERPNEYPTKLEILNVSPIVFQHVLEFIVSGSMVVIDPGEGIDVYLYGSSIGLNVANQTLGTLLKDIIQTQDVSGAVKVLNKLISNGIDITTLQFEKLLELVSRRADIVFEQHLYSLSKQLLSKLLQMELKIPEVIICKRVVDWGIQKYYGLGKTFSELLEEDKKKLRQQIADLLQLVRYEHMTLEEVMREIEPMGIFTQLEVFEILKAMPSAKSGTEYSVLGKTYPAGSGRVKRYS